MTKKRGKRVIGRRAQHPCAAWCEGRLKGIVENLKLTGKVGEDFEVDFHPLIGLSYIPGEVPVMTCQHGRSWAAVKREP